jgi:hypothetical protein
MRATPAPPESPAFDGPAPSGPDRATASTEAVLNPFSVYGKGEALLRRQLSALASWHLVNVITTYSLSERSADNLNLSPPSELIEIIVDGVRNAPDTDG